MKKKLITLALVLLATMAHAYTKPALLHIAEEKYKDTVELHLKFDILPKYTLQQTGKRINLILEDAIVADSALGFSPDDQIVKFLPQVSEEQAVLSFFLRYKPQGATLQPEKNNTLVLVIDTGNTAAAVETDIISGLRKARRNSTKRNVLTNPLQVSPYAHDWNQFFIRYESAVQIKTPVLYTLPAFPVIGLLPPDKEKNLGLIPPELNDLIATGQWNALEPLLADLVKKETDLEKGKKLALTYGEVLFRAGNFSGAYKQLYLLEQSYPNQPVAVFAKFLLAGLEAKFEDPHIGDAKFHELESSLEKDNPLTPYLIMLQIETALATNQLQKMKALLDRDDVSFPPDLAKIRELRQADYWFANNNLVKSYARYRLLNNPALLEGHPTSLNGYCDTLYQQKIFQEASQCYQKLARHITDKGQLGMVAYRKAMSDLHLKPRPEMLTDFSTLADAFPGTDAGDKAALKKTDLRFLTKKNWDTGGARAYRIIAEKATSRSTAEEAALKEALVYRISEDYEKSIDRLMTFLRNFRTGDLVVTAQAALIDILPGEIRRLVQQKSYVQALVLAKQNQFLFENNWLNSRILADIAVAYQQLNLLEEAKNTYLFLIESEGAKAEEDYALPLAGILLQQEKYDDVETYSAQYLKKYPGGKDARSLLFIRLRALLAANKIDQGIALLPSPLPGAPDWQEIAASLYFQKNDYKKITDTLTPLWEKNQPLSDKSRFMLAEGFYKQDLYEKAEGVFLSVQDSAPFQDQSLFRLASIQIKKGQTEKAVKLFKQLVEKGKDPLWQNLAKKELQYAAALSKK